MQQGEKRQESIGERRGRVGAVLEGDSAPRPGLGGEAFLPGQRLEIGDVGELLDGVLGSVELDDVHVLHVGELAVDRASALPAFEEDRLTFSECHAGKIRADEGCGSMAKRGQKGGEQGTGNRD